VLRQALSSWGWNFSLGFQFKSSLLSRDCQLDSTNMGKYKGKIKGKGKGLAAIGTDKEH
jgi:hypothetical protein